MSLFGELKRRNVFRVGAAYVAGSWFFLQIIETIFPAFGFDDAAMRIVTIILAIGLLPALAASWLFELTPAGLKREGEVQLVDSVRPESGKKLDRLIMALLALALGYFALDKFLLDPHRVAELERQKAMEVQQAREAGRQEALSTPYGDKSIAVLPFQNFSNDPENAYFADGLAEELLNVLSQQPELRVISRSSSFALKGLNLSAIEVGKKLNVTHVLEGSVRKSDDRIRVTTQLIDAQSDSHVWSETYDRKLEDIFRLQDEIASQVATQLKVTLQDHLIRKPKSAEAYLLVLRARHLANETTSDWREQSNNLYQQAIALDPNYCEALSGLAYNYLIQPESGSGSDLAMETAKRALSVDANCALAHVVLGNLAADTDLNLAAEHYEAALSNSPSDPLIIGEAGKLLFFLGRFDQAIVLANYSLARDPLNWRLRYGLTLNLLLAGLYDEVIENGRQVIDPSMAHAGMRSLIGAAMYFKGDAEGALKEFSEQLVNPEAQSPWTEGEQAAALHALGRTAEFNQAFEKYKVRWGHSNPFYIALALAMIDDHDGAFEWLGKAEEQGEPELRFAYVYSQFTPILDDPRWDAMLKRHGTSQAQRDAIKFTYSLPK
jgi:TolB-like protein/Flp pilus assembly protein TadD